MRSSDQTKLVTAEDVRPRVAQRSNVVRAIVLFAFGAVVIAAAVLGTYFAVWRPEAKNPVKKPLWADDDPYNRWTYHHQGLHQPRVVSDDGTYTEGRVLIKSETDSKLLELSYNATVIEDWERIICLDVDKRVLGVDCRGNTLTITWDSPQTALEQKDMVHAISSPTLITGGASWACHLGEVNTPSAGRTILHRVTEVVEISGSTLALRVSSASYTDIFRHLHLHLETHHDERLDGTDQPSLGTADLVYKPLDDAPYGDRGATVTNTSWLTDPSSVNQHGRRQLLLRWFGIDWGFVTKFLRTVAAIVRSAPFVEKAVNWVGKIVNGDMRLGPGSPINLRTWTWTGGQATLPGGVNLDIRQSNAKLALGVLFDIDIESWQLVSANLALQGDARATAHAKLSSDRDWNFNSHFPLFQNIGIGEVTFMVGPVPFHIAGQLDLDLLLQADGNAGASFSAGATASATARGGIVYKDGQWEGVTSRNWGVNRIDPEISARADGNVIFSLIPSVTLVASWIGGPTVSMVPYVATHISASQSSCDAKIGWGVGVQVGARIDIRNPVTGHPLGCNGCTHTWGQQEVWSTNNGQPQPLFECDGRLCGSCRRA